MISFRTGERCVNCGMVRFAKPQPEDSLTVTLRHAQKCVLLHTLLQEAVEILDSLDKSRYTGDEETRMTLMQMELELPGMAACAHWLVAEAIAELRRQPGQPTEPKQNREGN